MNAIPHTKAERAGRLVGRAWRVFVRQEARAIRWLASHRLPIGMAQLLLWIVKLVVFGVLLYAAFWLVLLLVFAVIAAWVARNVDQRSEDQEPEWRNGWEGYGLYRSGVRIDVGGTDEE